DLVTVIEPSGEASRSSGARVLAPVSRYTNSEGPMGPSGIHGFPLWGLLPARGRAQDRSTRPNHCPRRTLAQGQGLEIVERPALLPPPRGAAVRHLENGSLSAHHGSGVRIREVDPMENGHRPAGLWRPSRPPIRRMQNQAQVAYHGPGVRIREV